MLPNDCYQNERKWLSFLPRHLGKLRISHGEACTSWIHQIVFLRDNAIVVFKHSYA